MRPADRTTAVVVGAGAAGLGVAGALARRGVPAVVLERGAHVGDCWRHRYDRLRLHTARAFSGLPHHPIPRRCTRYVGKDDYAAYLEEYAQRLGLDVRLGTEVRRVARAGEGWVVETAAGRWRTAVVVVATGRYAVPSLPAWPGRASFGGRLLHAAEFRSGRELAGKRVLVVGCGNSGAEIATELTDHAASVVVSVRTPPPLARRDVAGIPLQLLGILLAPLPAGPVDRAGGLLRRVSVGDLRPYGFGEAGWGPFGARRPPVIDAGFVGALRGRRLCVVPEVVRLTADGAVFADGSAGSFDAIVAATGYRTSLPQLLDVPEALTDDGCPRSGSPLPGLYVVGFRESVRGQLYEAGREARRVACDIERQLSSSA